MEAEGRLALFSPGASSLAGLALALGLSLEISEGFLLGVLGSGLEQCSSKSKVETGVEGTVLMTGFFRTPC